MIGEIWTIIAPFYNSRTGRMEHKGRPALIIAQADNQDYVVLPVSSVSRRQNIHPTYDIAVDPAQYPLLGLAHQSYIRTHKQTVIHIAEIGRKIGDLKGPYEDLYLDVLAKREQFSEEITSQATAN